LSISKVVSKAVELVCDCCRCKTSAVRPVVVTVARTKPAALWIVAVVDTLPPPFSLLRANSLPHAFALQAIVAGWTHV
jgi:hypothetical protein